MTRAEANALLQTAWEGGYFSKEYDAATAEWYRSGERNLAYHYARIGMRIEELLTLPLLVTAQDWSASYNEPPRLLSVAERFFL